MTTQRRIPSLIAALFLLAACSSSVRIDQAEEVLRTYLADLHGGYYEGAALLFGGTFDQLEANNPDIDPTDRAGLLQRWCEQNGGVCLPIQIVVSRKAAGGGTFTFVVELAHDDGTTFEIGPCCGEEDTGERTRDFTFTVQSSAGLFQVLELPPYVP